MNTPNGIERDVPEQQVHRPVDEIGHFSLNSQHIRLTQVILRDQTDIHNELVFEQEWLLHTAERELELAGNLFVFEDILSGSGQIVLKTEALPHARPQSIPADIRVVPAEKGGFEVSVLGAPGDAGKHWQLLNYEGGEAGRSAVLHAFQQAQRPNTPAHRLPRFLSNTWGDRSRDSRIQHDFIAREIEAGARLGVEVVQIDDGWERGVTKNSARSAQSGGVWEGFWKQDPYFWQPSKERLPDGLEPLIAQARSHGMELGLWFGPDSWNDFANWQRDADCLLNFYHQFGIAHFKLDGIRMDTSESQKNLRSFMVSVLSGSYGQVVFDLDVTAQTRPGYFGAIEAGPLFVENRYTDWHRYWPHHTLRNLWKLSRWVDPRRLRMEWLNHARNPDKYASDPLAPAAWKPDALFATVMFSSPLGWFEVSNLPQSYFDDAAPLIAIWKQHREEIFAGTILPVGAAPDGMSWSGFVSMGEGGRSGYLVLFRQLAGETCRIHLPGLAQGILHCQRLAGSGQAEIINGEVQASRVDPLGYILIKFSS
jgi:alpha-galactosidase